MNPKPYQVLPKQVGKYLLKKHITPKLDEFDPVKGCVADASYAGLSGYTMILHALSKKVPEKLSVTNPLWNYFDSVCSIIMGLRQLIDPEDGLAFTRFKGAINVLNGVQQLTLTAISFAKYGTPSFVVAAGVTLAISIMDTVEVMLRRHNFDYWLRTEKARYLKMRSDLAKLEADIAALESLRDANDDDDFIDANANEDKKKEDSIHERLLSIKKAEKKALETAKDNCIQDIIARSKVVDKKDIFKNTSFFEIGKIKDSKMDDDFKRYEASYRGNHGACLARNNKISSDLEAESYEKITDTCIQTLVFAGMLLTCFSATPLQVVGLLCIGISIVWMAFKRATEENKTVKTPSLFFPERKTVENVQTNWSGLVCTM